MSEVKVNKITPRTNCGTVQLGDSGDTITIPAGATITNNGTQTGFGRTGTVDWDTTAKTASFTAVSGNGYFVDTSSSAITVTLPAGSAGDIIAIADYTNTFQTNAVTMTPNGSQKIGGVQGSATLNTEGLSVTFVYVDDTEGWKLVNDATSNTVGETFMVATGGTTSTCGDFKIHTFTGPGTFTVSCLATSPSNNVVDYLVVAGGAAGGGYGGGGGAGGFRFFASPTNNPQSGPGGPRNAPAGITVTATSFPVTVGAGGAGSTPPGYSQGNNGSNSVFSTITSAGGGGGGKYGAPEGTTGSNGGSGGGGGMNENSSSLKGGGTGNTPPVSPPQGSSGGQSGNRGGSGPYPGAGGGGGAMALGADFSGFNAGAGGAGGGLTGFGSCNGECSSCVQYFSGGGGGRGETPNGGALGGVGGGGKGAHQSPSIPGVGEAGTANTGGGAGGSATCTSSGGGSGIVIIRYKFQ